MTPNAQLADMAHIVVGFAPGTPSSSTPDYVSLKNFERCTIVIVADNATTVTGSAITLLQATSVGAAGEKALAFTEYRAVTDAATTDVPVTTAATNNTFTTDGTDNANGLYIIDVLAEQLDVEGGFDCLRVGTGDATSQTLSVLYILWPARYAGAGVSAITD